MYMTILNQIKLFERFMATVIKRFNKWFEGWIMGDCNDNSRVYTQIVTNPTTKDGTVLDHIDIKYIDTTMIKVQKHNT